MNFNFAAGSLTGNIAPEVYARGPGYALPALSFANTVYGVGSQTFSGRFDTNVSGLNSFSGLFAGSAAQDAAGNFAFPYLSPRSGHAEQASGAFVASRTGTTTP